MAHAEQEPQTSTPGAPQDAPGTTAAAEVVHTPPQKKSTYRRWFGTLNPSLQLVLLQLWMPVFMAVMFVVCYVGAFQHIAPHDVPVGIVGSAQAAQPYQQIADQKAPGAFAFSQVATVEEAKEKVRSGEFGVAYDRPSNTLIVAGAHQAQAATLLPTLVTPLLGADTPPKHQDIAPLPAGDIGMTPMYLMLAWCISGYLAAMFIGLMGGPLSRRVRFGVIFGVGLGLSGLMALLVDPVIGAIHGHFWALWGLGWVWSSAIGLAVNGLSYFCGRFIAAPAMTIFIFLSIPSSGAALPQWLMPEPFRWLNHVVVGSGITEMLKRMVYDVGPGYGRGWIMLACYAVFGLLLTLVGKRYWQLRRVRRMLTGRTTMMMDAQRASGRVHERETDSVLASFDLAKRDDGAIVRVPAHPRHGAGSSGHERADGARQDSARAEAERADGAALAESIEEPSGLGMSMGRPLEHELLMRPDTRPNSRPDTRSDEDQPENT
ncbi:ABC transporter permease [Galactobacter caseinivorans]|uniref:ABC transporter permease n=1 Tax=Galactobacter caseinivorans TaxID=2676123 RepID=A0A496PHL5_9MICC|nr:ABC transporter permease [Galactobacter caseinivorans]RKW69978.1 ABC transporter permease [Galactobacter caseinivorans]